jgi:hypothetical protein
MHNSTKLNTNKNCNRNGHQLAKITKHDANRIVHDLQESNKPDNHLTLNSIALLHTQTVLIFTLKRKMAEADRSPTQKAARHGPAPTMQSCHIGLSVNHHFDQKSAKNIESTYECASIILVLVAT